MKKTIDEEHIQGWKMDKMGMRIRDFMLIATISMSLSMGFVYGSEIQTLQQQVQELQQKDINTYKNDLVNKNDKKEWTGSVIVTTTKGKTEELIEELIAEIKEKIKEDNKTVSSVFILNMIELEKEEE